MNERTRAYLYRVALAGTMLAAAYGLVADDKVTGITALITALLGNGLAAVNTSTETSV